MLFKLHSHLLLFGLLSLFAFSLPGSKTFGVATHSQLVRVADFDFCNQDKLGGYYRVWGAKPDKVFGSLIQLGTPKSKAWRVDLTESAGPTGVGALFPLFDERGTPATTLPTLVAPGQVRFRMCGELNHRRLRVELISSANPEAGGIELGFVEPNQLDAHQWSDIALPYPSAAQNGTAVGFIRITAEGRGAAWFAFNSIDADLRVQNPPSPQATVARKQSFRTAMWVWTAPEIILDSHRVAALLDFCGKHEITDLFCQVKYATDPSGTVTLNHEDAIGGFNEAAKARKIAVHALDGAPENALPENHPRMQHLLEAVGRFNAGQPADKRFSGFHLDNEPYTLPGWRDDAQRQQIINGYVALNRRLRIDADKIGVEFGLDIPFWWDVQDDDGRPKFTYSSDAGPKPLLEAVFDSARNVGIMAYRDHVQGPDGSVAQCVDEFALGSKKGVDVLAAVELGMGKNVESGTSLGAFSKDYGRAQVKTMREILLRTPGCAGMAVHHYEPYVQLETGP